MRILYINHYAGGPSYGMEYRPYYLAREWVRAGHEVTIVAASQSHVRSRQPETSGRFTIEDRDGIRFVWCATPKYQGNGPGRVVNIFAFLFRLRQWRKWLDGVPDLVIASSTYPLDIYPARRLARHHQAKLVWEVHDLWPLSPIELGPISPRHPFMMLLQRGENAACRSADVVISLLPKAETHLQEHGMAPDKFVYVPNGIDPEEWLQPPTDLPDAHTAAIAAARDQGHFLICYAGAHGLANSLDTVVEAAAKLQQEPVTWLLVGDGPEKRRLQDRVAAERLQNVVFLDAVPKASIPTLLVAMDVLYFGLRREPLYRFGISPNKLMDYMMAGRPVICAIDSGNDLVAEAGCGITIPPEDPGALVEATTAMRRLGADERERLGAAGRAFVQQHHQFPVLAKDLLNAIR